MARSANTVWDMRANAAASDQGGGFVTGASGTDYSQQDSPNATYTDLVIDGAVNTDITSAADPFASDDVGNIIRINSGTGFTVGRYEVVSVAAAVATLDRVVGTTGSTGGNGKLGGALSQTDANLEEVEAGNICYIKADGTYSTAFNVATAGTSASRKGFFGYDSVHGDNPIGDSRPLFAMGGATALFGNFSHIKNLRATTTYALGLFGGAGFVVDNCSSDNTSGSAGFDGFSSSATNPSPRYLRSQASSTNGTAFNGRVNSLLWGCYAYDSVKGYAPYNEGTTDAPLDAINSVFDNCTTGVFWGIGNTGLSIGCTYYGCVDAIGGTDLEFVTLLGNILDSNSGYGVNFSTAEYDSNYADFNSYSSNTTGDRNNLMIGDHDIALDPGFVDPTGSPPDFSVGANMKEAGYPGLIPGLAVAGNMDLGAIQRVEPAGGGGNAAFQPAAGGGLT